VAGRLTDLLGALLALVIAAGTGLYVAGVAPPFPARAWAFNAALMLALALALLAGCVRGKRGPA
jgi:hypothetical protein